MPIPTETMRKEYTGNGSATQYAYTFLIYHEDHLIVYVDCVLQTLITDYSVSDVGDEDGGLVTFVTAPPDSQSIVIIRDLPFTQEADYVSFSPFRAQTHENILNKLTMLVLRNKERLDRALTLAECSLAGGIDGSPTLTLPDPVSGQGLRWKTDLTGLENYTI